MVDTTERPLSFLPLSFSIDYHSERSREIKLVLESKLCHYDGSAFEIFSKVGKEKLECDDEVSRYLLLGHS